MPPSVDPSTDPFGEHPGRLHRRSLHLLGALFRFESNSVRLLRLVDQAFAGLPRHRLSDATPRLRVRLLLTQRAAAAAAGEPPLLKTWSAPGLLCGALDAANIAVISPAQASALVMVSRDMLRRPYHVRYELIEFAVYVLAARAQALVPLHAAAVGERGRGLLLMGDSGAGKSTMALHCLLQGLQLVSEDAVFVSPAAMLATGIASFLHLRSSGLRLLRGYRGTRRIRGSPIIRRRSGEHKYEVDLRRAGYALAPAALKIRALVFLSKRSAGAGALLLPVARPEMIRRLTAHQPYAARQQGWARFGRNMAGVRAFELRRASHPRLAVDALRDLLAVAPPAVPVRSAPRA
jgi:hypothetical protein